MPARSNFWRTRSTVFAITLATCGFASAQSPADEAQALRGEIRAITESQAAIQKDLQEIRSMLQQIRQAPPPTAGPAPLRPQDIVLTLDGGWERGDGKTKLTIVEFTDYQCPFCSRYFRDTYPEIIKEYVNSGKVKYVIREFPLEAIHPHAFKAAEAAQCAGEQRKYFDMHDRLFSEQRALAASDLPKHAETLGLDMPKFQDCLASGRLSKNVKKDLADGVKAGVTGTPSFFLGVAQPNGTLKVVSVLRGAQPYPLFKDAIEGLLASEQ